MRRFLRSAYLLASAGAVLAIWFASCSSGGGGGGGPAYENWRVSGRYTFVTMRWGGNAQVGTLDFDGVGSVTYTLQQASAWQALTGVLPYTVTADNSITLGSGMVGSLRSGGSFFVTSIAAGQNEEAMLMAVKHSALATDQTATYHAGQYTGDDIQPVKLIEIAMATPAPGVRTYLQLDPVSGPSSTQSYALNTADGTLSVLSFSPPQLGALSPDNQVMVLADGEAMGGLFGMTALRLAGSGMTNASLSGTYLLHGFTQERATGMAINKYLVTRSTVMFDGNGSGTYTELVNSSGAPLSQGTLSYSVNPAGTINVNGRAGVALADGSVFLFVDTTTSYNAGDRASVSIGIKR